MKQIVTILGIGLLLIVLVGGGCGWSGYTTAKNFISGQLKMDSGQFKLFSWCFNGLPFINKLPQILDNKTYLVLLQNNTELRPTGGFMGSYAKIETAPTGIKNISVQDIYAPDGQLLGHVDPPLPIQQAFGQGWWKLRDSNWDPDFKIAGEQIAWFFDQGHEEADGLIAVNLTLVNSLLEIFGPLKLVDYPDTISSASFYSLAQKYAEVDFFPGSTQKKDFLGAVGRELVSKFKVIKLKQAVKLTKIVFEQLKTNQMLLWFKDSDLEKTAKQRKWTGELGDYAGGYLYLVETNLGANKANCCIERSIVQEVNSDNETLQIVWENNNLFTNPRPPSFWGGDYIDYVRLIIPVAAKINNLSVDDRELVLKPLDNQYGLQEGSYQTEDRDKFKIIGFWAKVSAQQSTSAIVSYHLPTSNSILIKRQPGIDYFDYKLSVNGRTIFNQKIFQDTVVKIDN